VKKQMLEKIASLLRQIEVADPFAPREERSILPAEDALLRFG
jgi:hypothetical protein